ncbi:MAG: glycosyltransferase [Pseudomonadota bacterium]|nr:glycosyltransferase [Pseudomonadota bacterium]
MRSPAQVHQTSATLPHALQGIDIVIPVYNAPLDVERCIDSVMRHTRDPYHLVLIDDASPDPEVGRVFERVRAMHLEHVELLHNEANLGFIGTANRGMQLSRSDVVLLNSDTIVTAGWLDALVRCAATNASFGTITPFSNNAEICSFPEFCQNNPWPDDADPELVRAALARAAVPTYPDLPTGVGFCMYIQRTLIDAIGVFDPVFGRGYGEENDLCLRGFAVGYRNVLCDDAFVLHLGGRSFMDHKSSLGRRNLDLLLARHPHYETMVQQFIAADPLRPLRQAALSQQRAHDTRRRGVLHVIHGHGGGTEHHVRALIDASRRELRHYLAIAVGDRWQFEEHLDDAGVRSYELEHQQNEPWADFVGGICASFGIDLIHLHNISGCREGLAEAMEDLPIAYGYTVHDLNFACPTITFLARDGMYCGGVTDAGHCRQCLGAQSSFAGIDIVDWRAKHQKLLQRASFIIAPTQWAADELTRYFPSLTPEVIPHAAPGSWALQDGGPARSQRSNARLTVLMPADDVPTLAVLGAIGPDKGARRLERMVELARANAARVRFVLIGYTDRERGPWQSEDALFTIHGPYRASDLPALLDHYRVQMVMFPSAGPETFSFTLSETWVAGRPALVPPIGALAERVRGTDAGWVWSAQEWRSEDRMLEVALSHLADRDGLRRAGERGRVIVQPTPATMVARTTAVYARVQPRTSDSHEMRPLAPIRLRDGLGYRLWYPPPQESNRSAQNGTSLPEAEENPPVAASVAPAPNGTGRSIATRALYTLIRTPLGKALRVATPRPLRDALRARLKP